jgi:hypothetical protein
VIEARCGDAHDRGAARRSRVRALSCDLTILAVETRDDFTVAESFSERADGFLANTSCCG